MKRIITLFTLLPFLAGCTLGPNYSRPTVDVPPDWRWKKAEPRDTVQKGPWWEIFNDKELNRLEAAALAGNQDLKAAIARVDQARSHARVARSEFFPDVSLDPSYERYRTSGSQNPGLPTSVTAATYSVPFDLSYEIDIWGKVRRGFESARYQLLASSSEYQNILFTLQADVAINYYQLRGADHDIESLRKAVKLRQETLDIFQKRFEAGYTSELDVTRSQTELASAKADLAAAQRSRAEFENAIAVLCGVPPANVRIAPLLVTMVPPEVKAGLPSEVLERRPDVAAAERTLAAKNAEIGVAYAAFFPAVRLTASAGTQSVELQDIFNWESRVWTFGPSISLPLFTGGRNKANLDNARAAYEEAVANYRQSILVAFQEVDNSLAGLRFLRDQSVARNDAVVSAKKSAELSLSRYTNGVVDYLDVIDAERSRLDTELAAHRVDTQRMITTVTLVKAIGGGWNVPLPSGKEDDKKNAEAAKDQSSPPAKK